MPFPKIAIIGAGPGGLTLARLLKQNSIPCTVYESEKDRTSRNQGGTIDLHPKAGQLALREAGLFDEFKKHARPEGEATKVVKYDGSVLWDDREMGISRSNVEEGDRPEIDRLKLRDMLLDSVGETVKWDQKLLSVEPDSNTKGKHNLHFADGSTEMGIDLVVGADGAWSKVRGLLTDEKPFYSGVSMIEIWASDVEKRHPWLSNYVGEGSVFMFDEGRVVICQRNGEGAIRTYAGLQQPEDWIESCGINWSDKDAVKEALVNDYFADCGEDVKRLIREGDSDELIPRKLWMLPVGIKWESRPGVTLLGDAAHLMTPFAGVGVNVAMADALELAKALVDRKDSLRAKVFSDSRNIATAIKDYETSMFERGEMYAQKTMDGLTGHFSAHGGEERAGKLRQRYEMRKAAGLVS